MSFVNKFPKRWFEIGGKDVLLSNLTLRVTIPPEALKESVLMQYRIEDGERPDQISMKLYDTDEYWWLVLMANRITNYNEQWPRMEESIYKELDLLADPYATKYYVFPDGTHADVDGIRYLHKFAASVTNDQIVQRFGLRAISYTDDAIEQNERKRRIKLIDPDYVEQFADYLETVLNE